MAQAISSLCHFFFVPDFLISSVFSRYLSYLFSYDPPLLLLTKLDDNTIIMVSFGCLNGFVRGDNTNIPPSFCLEIGRWAFFLKCKCLAMGRRLESTFHYLVCLAYAEATIASKES